MDLLQKWMKDHRETVQDVLEQVALEQLMSTLPWEVSIWVQEKKPRTAIEAGQLDVICCFSNKFKLTCKLPWGGV